MPITNLILKLALVYFTTLLLGRFNNGNLNWLLFFNTNLNVLFTYLMSDIVGSLTLELMADT